MKRETQPELEQVLPALYELQSLETLPGHCVAVLEQLLPGDSASYNEVNLRRSRLVHVQGGSMEMNRGLIEAFEAHVREHPVIEDYRQTGIGDARAISDFLSVSELHRTGLYQEFLRRLEVEDQLSITLRASPGTVVALTVNRHRRYTEADRSMLNRLRPHLLACYRNAESLTLLQEELSRVRGVLDQFAKGVAVLDRRGRVAFLNTAGKRLLGSLGSPTRRGLPAPLQEWLAVAGRRARAGRGPAAGSPPFHWSTGEATVVVNVRRDPGGAGLILTLEEHARAPRLEPLMALGLTRREAEVLWWVAEGKSNVEAGLILQIAHRTVQKHLERVFVKLGVENRTAASARAMEAIQWTRA